MLCQGKALACFGAGQTKAPRLPHESRRIWGFQRMGMSSSNRSEMLRAASSLLPVFLAKLQSAVLNTYTMKNSAPYSSEVQEEGPRKPVLSALHLWRVTPCKESLHKIIHPARGQLPIIFRASRLSLRKVILGVWVVSDGEAMTVSVYDPKAVQYLEMTFLCGWWAELGIPPLKSMTISGLGGVAAFLVQGISLQIPEPDRKGRVDMSKASLQFNPGPPPPLFEFSSSQFDSSILGESRAGVAAKAGERVGHSRVIWRGMRTFRQRAVLLACARNGPSMIIVQGWDSSMAWRMTNVVTFHEEDWKTWKEIARPAREPTGCFFRGDNNQGGQEAGPSESPAAAADQEQRDQLSCKGNGTRQASHTANATATGTSTYTSTNADADAAATARPESTPSEDDETKQLASNGGSAGTENPSSAGGVRPESSAALKDLPIKIRHPTPDPPAYENSTTDQARIERLCQAIADRVEVRTEGTGGKLALRAPRRRGEGHAGASGGRDGESGQEEREEDDEEGEGVGDGEGVSDGGLYGGGGGLGAGGLGLGSADVGHLEKGKDSSVPNGFLSYKDMEERVRVLDEKEHRGAASGDGLAGPRRPLEDTDGGVNEWLANLPGGRSVKAFARRRGANGKLRTMEEIVEQLVLNKKKEEAIATAKRQEAVKKWKNVGKVLCRLLRMSDYWYGFASDGSALSGEEKATRRISVLHQIVEMRGVGRTTMKTLVRAIAEKYPRSVWSRFRQLMRQPKAQRKRRDMAVCAILLGDIDNQFFKHTTAGWSFSRLVNLASDMRLVKKPTLAVLYEEGETPIRAIGRELAGEGFRREDQGTQLSPQKRRRQQQEEEQGDDDVEGGAGAYVILQGLVDLFILERGPAADLPTVACQENLAAKACRGQPMLRPRPPAEWEVGDGAAAARQRQRAVAEHVEAVLSGSGPGPRRARTRNVAPRWRACRLGAGALFGDRPPVPGSTPEAGPAPSASERMSGPALETAIIVEETELLEIGVSSYRRYLANGVQERTNWAVAVLKATGALNGVPTPALARICRYATDRSAGQAALNAPQQLLLNPTPRAASVEPRPTFSCYEEREDITDDDRKRYTSDGDGDNDGKHSNGRRNKRSSSKEDNNENRKDLNDHKYINNSIGDDDDKSTVDDLVLCQKGTFRGTVFFVAEGRGEVVLNFHDGQRESPLRPEGGGGCSSTESLLAATAFSRRRTLRNRHNRRNRYRGKKLRGSSDSGRKSSLQVETPDHDTSAASSARRREGADSSAAAGPAVGEEATAELEQRTRKAVADDEGATTVGRNSAEPALDACPGQQRVVQEHPSQAPSPSAAGLTISFADQERRDWWESGKSGYERWPRQTAPAALLKRGDFFGVDPAPPPPKTAEQVRANTDEDDRTAGTASPPCAASNVAISATAGDYSGDKGPAGEALSRRAGLIPSTGPSAIFAEPTPPPAPTFPGLHMASLVADPGGIRCLAVGLAVLQKICPPVHRRLARTASNRYSGWVTEARRRHEAEWQESLETGSVRSLSRSFYDSFAKGDCSGSVAVQGTTDMGSSVGWTISDDGRGSLGGGVGGRGSALSLVDGENAPGRHGDGGDDEAAVEAAPPIATIISAPSLSSSAPERRSIYGLSRTYIELALCSSGRSVVPVRLGRSIVQALSRNSRKRPVPPRADAGNTPGNGTSRRSSPRAAVAVTVIPRVVRPHCFAPASPTLGSAGSGPERARSRPALSRKKGRREVDHRPTPSSPRRRSSSPTRAGINVADTTSSEVVAESGDQDPGSVGGGCSRGRRCGARPSHKVGSASSGGVAVLDKYNENETYNCPVSPFSIPPSWAEIPPSIKLEPGCPLSPPNDTSVIAEEEGSSGVRWNEGAAIGQTICRAPTEVVEHAREHHPVTKVVDIRAESTSGMGTPSLLSLHSDNGAKTGDATRPAESTSLQVDAFKGQASYGWRWNRPSGDRGRRRRKGGMEAAATVLSPSREEGRLSCRVGPPLVFPLTS